jgi:hypothetical protein
MRQGQKYEQIIVMTENTLSKKEFRCKWTWETTQLYTWTQTKVI